MEFTKENQSRFLGNNLLYNISVVCSLNDAISGILMY